MDMIAYTPRNETGLYATFIGYKVLSRLRLTFPSTITTMWKESEFE
jgi:hypothetical protein